MCIRDRNVLRTGARYRALIDVPDQEDDVVAEGEEASAATVSPIGLADPDRDPLDVEMQLLQRQLAALDLPDFTIG